MDMFKEWARVLVAEDNEINRQVALEVLRGAGLAVDLAVNGQAAVERARSQRYDLILMDLRMPVMDGLEATRAIRALPEGGNTPILAITAYTEQEWRGACEEAGMNDFITKPVQIDELYARTLRWLALGTGALAGARAAA
jgi:CheY-like chemotaxis protein